MYSVYLIHFHTPLCHARHYIGMAQDVTARLAEHKAGYGARILQVCNERSIDYSISRTWNTFQTASEAKQFEKYLKSRKEAPNLCPVCNENAMNLANKEKTNERKDEIPF